MDEYLPKVYTKFTERYPSVSDAEGQLAKAVREAVPFDERTSRLLKLALSIGAQSHGAVRSNVRKGLEHGLSLEEIRAVSLLAVTTCGFPAAIAGYRLIEDVVQGEGLENPD